MIAPHLRAGPFRVRTFRKVQCETSAVRSLKATAQEAMRPDQPLRAGPFRVRTFRRLRCKTQAVRSLKATAQGVADSAIALMM